MEIKKAVITAAGKSQRNLPLQTLVDRDGKQKSALAIIIEEVLQAEVEEICVVIHPGDETAYRAAAGPHAGRLTFMEQTEPFGYAHAVYSARHFTKGDAFLLLVGDHLYITRSKLSCSSQLVEMAKAESCAISAVQSTHESKLPYYGAVGGRLVNGRERLYQVDNVLEKPSPTEAEQRLIVPGLRTGNYLCFFGMHVLTARTMDLLGEMQAAHSGKHSLSEVLQKLVGRERYLALEMEGRRYDIGVRYGLLYAQLALAFNGQDRDEVVTQLLELVAQR